METIITIGRASRYSAASNGGKFFGVLNTPTTTVQHANIPFGQSQQAALVRFQRPADGRDTTETLSILTKLKKISPLVGRTPFCHVAPRAFFLGDIGG